MTQNNQYEQSETQRIIDLMQRIESDGFKGGIVMSADGQKSKNLSISVAQAIKIQAILVEGDIPLRQEAAFTLTLVSELSSGMMLDLGRDEHVDPHDKNVRLRDAYVTVEAVTRTNTGIIVAFADFENVRLPEDHQVKVVALVPEKAGDKVYAYAVSDESGETVLETDDIEAARECVDDINDELSEDDRITARAALMERNSDGTGYTRLD